MSTVSTDAIYQLLIARLLTYVDPDGHTLGDANALGTRLYRITAPDNVSGGALYGVLTLQSPQLPEGTDGLKLTAQLELMLFGRPRSQQAVVEGLGDRALSALLTYRDASSGLVWFENAVAQSLPRFAAPADSDLVQVRVLAKLHCYPTLLSRLSS